MKISHINASSKKRLIIIRHEPTHENNSGIIQGQSIGGTLVSKKINPNKVKWCSEHILFPAIIVSSTTTRAGQSARCFSEILDISLCTSPLFIQRRWGDVTQLLRLKVYNLNSLTYKHLPLVKTASCFLYKKPHIKKRGGVYFTPRSHDLWRNSGYTYQ